MYRSLTLRDEGADHKTCGYAWCFLSEFQVTCTHTWSLEWEKGAGWGLCSCRTWIVWGPLLWTSSVTVSERTILEFGSVLHLQSWLRITQLSWAQWHVHRWLRPGDLKTKANLGNWGLPASKKRRRIKKHETKRANVTFSYLFCFSRLEYMSRSSQSQTCISVKLSLSPSLEIWVSDHGHDASCH